MKTVKIISEKSGLHSSLVEYLKRSEPKCSGLFVTKIRVHSLKQVDDECILSVEVRKHIGNYIYYESLNITT